MNPVEYAMLGLEPRDINVYEALYRSRKSSLRAVAQATGLNRGTAYEIIKKLTSMGLVTFTQAGSRRHFSAADPEVFLSLIRERRERLRKLEVGAGDYAERLRSRSGNKGTGYSAQFYEGDEGIASILRDVLLTVQELEPKRYYVVSSERASNFIYNNFRSFSRRRVELGIFVQVVSETAAKEHADLSERRLLVAGESPLDGYILIYGDKTALISLSETNELSGIVVQDVGITTMQRLIFEQLWRGAEPGNY